jgi:hypothetical protein
MKKTEVPGAIRKRKETAVRRLLLIHPPPSILDAGRGFIQAGPRIITERKFPRPVIIAPKLDDNIREADPEVFGLAVRLGG